MKKALLTIALIIVAFCSLIVVAGAVCVVDSNDNLYYSQTIEIQRKNNTPARVENTFYLPSNTTPQAVKLVYENGSKETVNLGSSVNDDNGKPCYKRTIEGVEYTFYFSNNLPSVYVDISITEENLLKNQSKDEYAKTTITDKFGTVYYLDNGTNSEIKVRGNATTNYLKLPFQLKLNKKTSILGMAEAKTWILLANYDDQSLLRNSIVYKIGAVLGMDTCDFKSVDLYIDGKYQGIYLLCEKVQIQENRVNIYDLEEEMEALNQPTTIRTKKLISSKLIDETIIKEYQYVEGVVAPEDYSGGYLIELDNNYYKDENCYFITDNNHAYVIKSPENCSKEQVEYIARVFAEMEEAIFSPTGKNARGLHYSQYVDVDSFVYAYIVAEISRNWDAASSLYFYKDKDVNGEFSKIVKGPLWDCDNTLGNMLKGNANNPTTYWASTRSFWAALVQHEYFNYRVAEEYARIYPTLLAMCESGGYIDSLVQELGSSITMEQSRWQSNQYKYWPMYSEYIYPGVHYDDWQSSQTFQFFETYSDGTDDDATTTIGYLKNHLYERVKWLNDELEPRLDNEKPSVSTTPINTLIKPHMLNITPSVTPPASSDVDTDNTTTDSDVKTDVSTDTGGASDTESATDTNTSIDTGATSDTNTDSNNANIQDTPKNNDDSLIIALVAVSAIALTAIIVLIAVIAKKKNN